MDIVKEVYRLTAVLPTEEKYGLSSQMKRCAVSIPSNIAEGSCKKSPKHQAHFIEIAIGSTFELETQLLICIENALILKDDAKPLLTLIEEEQKMTYAYQQRLTND